MSKESPSEYDNSIVNIMNISRIIDGIKYKLIEKGLLEANSSCITQAKICLDTINTM
jgi:hypothetical protein